MGEEDLGNSPEQNTAPQTTGEESLAPQPKPTVKPPTPTTAEELVRQAQNLPRLPSTADEPRGFRLNYGEVYSKPGTRYNLLGQKIYDPPPLSYDGRLTLDNTPQENQTSTVSRNVGIQTRGLNVITAVNQSTVADFSTRLFNRLGNSLQDNLGNSAEQGLALTGARNIAQPRTIQSTLLDTLTNMGRKSPEAVSMPAASRASSGVYLSSYAQRNANPQSVLALYNEIAKLKSTLGNGVDSIEIQYADRVVNRQLQRVAVGVRVGVKNYNELYDGLGLYGQSAYTSVGRSHYFNFTVNQTGQVIETTSNRLITGSLISSSGGAGGRLSAFNTVKGLISTYVKSAELEAKHGVVDSLFNAMVSRGDYSPLGRVFAEMLISRDETFIVNKGNRFNRTVETILNAKGFSGLEADLNRVIDSISAKGLNYYHTIGQVMQDMNNDPQAVKEAYSKMYSQRRAALRRALDPLYKVASFRGPSFESSVGVALKNVNLLVSSDTEVFEYSVDGKQIKLSIFDDLKAAALGMSPVGKAKYDFRKNQASSSILQLLMSPYLMPHETGYSGAQAVARLGFYNMSETRGGRSMYQILPAMYRHGFAGTQPGEYYKPIAAQSAKSSLVKYTAGYFNFDAASHKVVEFFDNSVLFRGMPSLMRSSLKEVKLHLERIGYNNAQEVIREFRTRMNLKEDEDENTEILLTPFRKPEQISQRLKNLVGGRSMYELSTSVRSALKEQNQSAINNLFEDTQDGLHFSASYLAGEVPANLNTIQYEYVLRERAKIIQELNYNETQLASDVNKQLDVSNRLVKRLREIQLDPFKDVGGLVIGRATRRAAVGMGISALSDFMFVNQEYLVKSSFGYSHVVNYNIPKTTSTYYEGVGNVRQVDPYFEAKVERYKQVFKAGTTIYMNAHELKNEGALAALNTAAGVFRQQLKDRGLSGESLTRAIRTQLLNNFSALQSVDITEEGLQATLKPGAYRFDSTGIMRFEGEIVDGSLRIGLLPKRGKYTSLGGGVLSQRYASEFIDLKVAGLSRGITDGIAFVLSDVKFKPGQGGGVEPEVALTILTDFATGSRHDSLTKGPIVATKGYDAFNDVFRSSLLSRQAKADPIYGVMGPSVFKSYNYESGLEILRDLQSKTSLLNIDSREKVFLLSLAFLDKNNGELKQALLDYIDNSSLKNKPALKLLVQSYQGSGPKKLQNLLINAPDVITLLGGGQLNKVGGYLAKLLQSGNFNDFESKLQSIFQRADESSVEIIRQVEGKSVSLRTYRESDFSVRSAALIADILYTTQQIINPNLQLGKITGGKPLEGYNFINADGQVRVQDFVSNAAFREATLDIAQKLGYRNKFLPSQKTLTAAIERGLQPGDKLYKKVQELLLAVHYSFQTSPFIERAVNLMPSRVLYPTGSEDAVGLEYHYSLSMSQREFNQLRGIGVDVENFSQVQAAYSTIVTHGSANRISRLMEVVSPFGADQTQVNLSQKVAQLLDNYNRFSAEHKFLGSGRNLSLLDQLVRQLTLGSDKYNTTLSQYELVNQAINYQQPGTQYEQTRALNVINALEPGRLQLESLQDSQLVDLARLYNIHSLNRAKIIESLRALGPITGQAVQYYGLSSNVDDPRRLSVSRAISEYAETRTAFGGDLLYGLSEDSVRTFLQNNAVDYQTFKSAIDLVTNPITGRLATGKNTYDIVNRLQEHDANIEKMLANAAGANKTKTYVQALERIASGAQQVINYSNNALQKERAFRLRQEIFQTRSILLPSMEVFGSESDPMIMLYDPSEGRRHITYEATPIIQLGLDVLSEIPTEFESYTNEVIRNQQRIRELLPEFQSIMGRLHEGPILKATVEEAKLIKEIQSLAIQSQSDVEQIFGSVLQQRAENEKIKYPGASFIAVASYLATPSEAFTGGRVFGGSLGEVVNESKKLERKKRKQLQRKFKSENISFLIGTDFGNQRVDVFSKSFIKRLGLSSYSEGKNAFTIQDRLRGYITNIRTKAATGDLDAVNLLNALSDPKLSAGLSEKNKVTYNELKKIVESKSKEEDKNTIYQSELENIQRAIRQYNPTAGTVRFAGNQESTVIQKKGASATQRQILEYNNRRLNFTDYSAITVSPQEIKESAAVERISQMTGYVHRAGGLTGASQGTNMLHNVKDIPEIISRGEANSNQLSLTLDGNHTALIVSMYGRFGVHGGDFDGDSYQLIFGYRDIQESLLKAIRNRDTIRSSLATIENTDASDSTYLAYLDNKKADLRQSLQSAQAAVDDLVNRVNEFSTVTAGRIKQGMRRHVAAFAGIPLSIIMNEDYYSDEQISNMIEQQRGITPGLTDIGSDYASTGDYFRLAGRLADRLGPTATKNQALTTVDTLFSGEDTGLVNQFKLLLSASSAFEGDVSNIKEKFFEEISEMTNLQVALATANKFIESSAGSIFDLRTFEALQTSIGSVGTSLIGEGYNAITTMIGRSVMARTLGTVIQDSIQTPSPDSFVNRLIQKLDNLSSDSALTNIKESAQNVKGKFLDYELERTQHFTQERGQRLQMNLGLIQQIIRDSLKPKEKQGVIDALVKGNTSVRDKLLDESLDDTTRTNILRDFLSTQAVTSMVDMISPKALDKNIDVTKTTTGGLINTFGAIFLLADYTREQNPAKFLAQGSGDRYNVLRRYRDIYTNPDVYKTGGHNLDIVTQLRLEDQEFVGKIRSDDNYLVRQAITDMINMATAQEAFSKYAGYDEGTWIDQAKARRESYLKALADVNSESPLHFKNEQHRVAVMRSMHISDLDINAYKQNQVADHTFDLESARLSLLNVSYVESTYLGMTEADVEFSRKVTRAAGELKNMSYETKESFVPFIAAQNENAVAIQQMARRGKLQDPVAMRDFQVGSAARLFDAIDRVNSNLTVKYGNLENAMSKTDVYQAYSQIADLSGVFDLNAQDSETLSFALMASKEDSQALFKHLANVSAGQAYVLEKGRQLDSIYEKYQNADDSSRLDLDRQRSLIDEDLYLLKEALNNNVNSPELQSRLAEVGERERLRMTEESKGRRMARLKLRDELKALPTQQSMHSFGVMNTLELFAAPVVGSVLMQQPLNERLIMGTYDILQGLATVESFSSNAVAAEANRLFRISRFKDHIMQNESLLLGAAQGFLAESVYMGLASFVSSRAEALSQRFNPKGRQGGGGIGGVVAEAAVTAAALAFTRRGNEYGIDNKPYRNLAAEALLGIADETEEAVSSWLDKAMDIQVETEDQIVTFDFDPSITPSQYEERIVTGWVDMTYSDDSIGPNSFDSIYYEAGSYLGE